jgi:hypothetical protein
MLKEADLAWAVVFSCSNTDSEALAMGLNSPKDHHRRRDSDAQVPWANDKLCTNEAID